MLGLSVQPLAGYHTHPSSHLLQVKIFEEDFQRERSDRERMNEEKEELKKQVEKLQAQVSLTNAQVRAPPWPCGVRGAWEFAGLWPALPLRLSSDLCRSLVL